MPKKIIKNCVYEFAVALTAQLSELGFCQLAPVLNPAAQGLLELEDSELIYLEKSILDWQVRRDCVAISILRNGETVIVIDVNVRKPRGGRYHYGVYMTLVHVPTNRILSRIQRRPIDPLYWIDLCGPIGQYFRTVANDLPDFSSRNLSKDIWQEHGARILDYYLSGIKNDLLPQVIEPWLAKDLLLFCKKYIDEQAVRKVFPLFNKYRPLPTPSPYRPEVRPVGRVSEVILSALAGYPDLGVEIIGHILEEQERREAMVPDPETRRSSFIPVAGDMEYIDDNFLDQYLDLVKTVPKES